MMNFTTLFVELWLMTGIILAVANPIKVESESLAPLTVGIITGIVTILMIVIGPVVLVTSALQHD